MRAFIMNMRMFVATMALAVSPACGGIARVAGYVDALEECSASSSGTSEMGSGENSESGESNSSGGSGETTAGGSEAMGTSTGSSSSGDGSTGTTSSSSSTGEPMGECGNGVLETFGAEPEECDDGNLDPEDGCDDTCALDRRVFVSSTLHQGGNGGGLTGLTGLKSADAICANLADDQGWPEGLSYRAWLSDSETDARDRLKRGRGRLVMVNGLVLARSWEALLAGDLENPLEVTEKSETYQGWVWTGTRPDGTAVPGSEHCEDWKTDSIFPTGHFGYSDRMMGEWTLAIDVDQPIECFLDLAIYCFQSL
jgi:cysteine-rich repeat protein